MKTYLVIGASGSIGSKTSELLEKNGCQVIRSQSKKLIKDDLKFIHLDFTNYESISALNQFNEMIDGVIFASGFEPQKSINEMDVLHQQKMLDIHVIGPINTVKFLLKNFKEDSSIIFISSISAQKGSYDPMYAIAKGAVQAMCKTLSVELSKHKIRVNCIAPGLVQDTPVFNRMTQDFRDRHINNTLDKKLATPEDCAKTIYFLLQQDHINGQVIHINGGQYFGN